MKKLKEMKKNNKGFSLVELIIVIAIMAVLMAVLAPQLLRYVERSRYQKDMSAVGELENAMKIATSNETAIVGTTFPVTCTIDHTNGEATFTSTGTVGTAFTDEIEATIMGAAGTDVDLNFTSTTLTGASGTNITIVITNTGITTVTNNNTAP